MVNWNISNYRCLLSDRLSKRVNSFSLLSKTFLDQGKPRENRFGESVTSLHVSFSVF